MRGQVSHLEGPEPLLEPEQLFKLAARLPYSPNSRVYVVVQGRWRFRPPCNQVEPLTPASPYLVRNPIAENSSG